MALCRLRCAPVPPADDLSDPFAYEFCTGLGLKPSHHRNFNGQIRYPFLLQADRFVDHEGMFMPVRRLISLFEFDPLFNRCNIRPNPFL